MISTQTRNPIKRVFEILDDKLEQRQLVARAAARAFLAHTEFDNWQGYNRRVIMRRAWAIHRLTNAPFELCLRKSWADAIEDFKRLKFRATVLYKQLK